MTKLLQRVEVTLRSFYIFNSRFGKADGEEHKKIVYYYPDDIEINTKIKDVGLSEAIIAFTSTFTEASNDCESLYTQKTTQVFYQPEPEYWMVLVLNVPKEIRTKDGIECAEYRGGEVHDRIYRAVLEQCYNMFRLYNGTFQMNYDMCEDRNNVDSPRLELQKKLSTFYDKHLLSIKWPACDITDISRSLQYLALDKLLFLNAHNFVNSILEKFSVISEAILLYKEHVVCGGKFHPQDLFYVHKHILEEELLSKMPSHEVRGNSGETVLSRSNSTITEFYRDGSFITNTIQQQQQQQQQSYDNDQDHNNDDDGDGLVNFKNITCLPKLYLGKGNALLPYYLIAYRALDATLCFFISSNANAPSQDFYDELHSYLGPKLSVLSDGIAESISNWKKSNNSSKQTTTSVSILQAATNVASTTSNDCNTPKYIFINEQSLKHLSNISIDRKRPHLSLGNATSNVLQLIADLDNPDVCSGNVAESTFKETLIKTTNDFWIVRRSCNWRRYYVIIFNTKLTLLDVSTEAMRVFEQEIPDDVFFYK